SPAPARRRRSPPRRGTARPGRRLRPGSRSAPGRRPRSAGRGRCTAPGRTYPWTAPEPHTVAHLAEPFVALPLSWLSGNNHLHVVPGEWLELSVVERQYAVHSGGSSARHDYSIVNMSAGDAPLRRAPQQATIRSHVECHQLHGIIQEV